MNQKERKAFWDVLCSLDGKDLIADIEKLDKTINYPQYIYRYRAVSLSTIDALQKNRVFFSTANHYDDPFDTLLHIDFNRIREEGRRYLSSDAKEQHIRQLLINFGLDDSFAPLLKSSIDGIDKDAFINSVIEYIKQNIQCFHRERLWTACFTEDGNNETMWIKYADQYKGFSLVYDLQNLSKDLCGTQEKCKKCVVNKEGTSLYPVYYSDDGYDATEYAQNFLVYSMVVKLVGQGRMPNEIASKILSTVPVQFWQLYSIALIKSKCHEYDKEWRLFMSNLYTAAPVMKEWIPDGVILGLKMSDFDKELVIRSAQMSGVDHVYESYINDEYRLDHRELKL